MKKAFLLVFTMYSVLSFGQSINDYEFVMVPTKFEFQKIENQHRLNTLLKFRLEEYGFKAVYTSNELTTNFEDRCRYLYANLIEDNGLLITKVYLVFNDCNGATVFKSAVGTSRQKNRKAAYTEALETSLLSVKALNYKFNGTTVNSNLTVFAVDKSVTADEKQKNLYEQVLFAQTISNGFQLVDTTPKVILKMLKTSVSDYFIAIEDTKNGIVLKKNGEWFFEYYVAEKLIVEKLNIKF